jgi:hypothetical protein
MKWNEVFCNTFRELHKKTEPEVRRQIDFMLPSMPMVEACRADDFDFFRPFIESGDLSIDQMHHAASRYFLGKTRSGQPVFWMIDDMHQPLDAHLGDTWISKLLKDREPLLECWEVQHCLFGLHLSSDMEKPVAIVESESSAAVLSELLPDSLWMAYATTSHLVPELLAPLEGRTVTIYPRTDPTMSTYLFFLDYANIVRRQYDINIQVDATLEDHATPDQKDRCIDIIDFFLE